MICLFLEAGAEKARPPGGEADRRDPAEVAEILFQEDTWSEGARGLILSSNQMRNLHAGIPPGTVMDDRLEPMVATGEAHGGKPGQLPKQETAA